MSQSPVVGGWKSGDDQTLHWQEWLTVTRQVLVCGLTGSTKEAVHQFLGPSLVTLGAQTNWLYYGRRFHSQSCHPGDHRKCGSTMQNEAALTVNFHWHAVQLDSYLDSSVCNFTWLNWPHFQKTCNVAVSTNITCSLTSFAWASLVINVLCVFRVLASGTRGHKDASEWLKIVLRYCDIHTMQFTYPHKKFTLE